MKKNNGQGSLPRRRTNTKTLLNCSELTELNTELILINQYYTNSKQYLLGDYSGRSQSDPHFVFGVSAVDPPPIRLRGGGLY